MSASQTKVVIKADKAPKPIGAYSVAIQSGNLVFTSGQIGLDPQTGNLVAGGIEAETCQVMENLKNVLEAAGSGLDKAVKATVFLRDINDFGKMNPCYASYMGDNPPARSVIQAAALPRGASVEIDVVAFVA